MTVEDFYTILSLVRKMGVFSVSISGGEPLCHSDFAGMCTVLTESQLFSVPNTNGCMIDAYADLINATFSSVHISIDGPEHLHDTIRGAKCFRMILDNLNKIKLRKLMCITLTALNYAHLQEMVAIALDKGFDGICIFAFKPLGRGHLTKPLLALTQKELQDIAAVISQLKKETDIRITYADPLTTTCYAGKRLLYVRADGSVTPCAYSDLIIGNILTEISTLRNVSSRII
jgi:MoaA/NifB/PqqE/SkfB family radical SAM enzyme